MDGDQGNQALLTFVDGQQIPFIPDPDVDNSTTPTALVSGVIAKINDAKTLIKKIESNDMLSPKAKAAQIEEIGDELIASVVRANMGLDAMQAGMGDRESQWLAPPAIAKDDPVGFLQDEAKRQYVAKLSTAGKGKFFDEARAGQHADIIQAMVRSPVPNGWEGEQARDLWADRRRAEDPDSADRIATGYRSHAWGTRSMSFIGAMATRTAKADSHRIKRIVTKVTGKT